MSQPLAAALDPLDRGLARLHDAAAGWRHPVERRGRVVACDGSMLQVEGLDAAVGALAAVIAEDGSELAAEVAGFRDGRLILLGLAQGPVAPGAVCRLDGERDWVPAGRRVLGRVVDALGRPLDGLGPLPSGCVWPLAGRPLAALDRQDVTQAWPTGVRAIDALLTLGRGQRVALAAGTGVGKTMLMHQLVRGATADAVVVGLVGERGREIAGFVDQLQGPARAQTVVVASPADEAAPMRLRAAHAAFAIAESLRAEGLHVLLIVDSLTRAAQAQREIGVAVGEAVGARGFPPSAVALIPRLVERAGRSRSTGGAVTAVLTVLAEGDDLTADPIVDAARGVCDGHVLLSRAVAASGRFPAIDLGRSISRTMEACVAPAHAQAARRFRRDWALVEANRDLVAMGAWTPGGDPALDRAMARREPMESFVRQAPHDFVPFAAAVATLEQETQA